MTSSCSLAFSTLRSRIAGVLERLASDRTGASALVIGLAMTGVLGLTGLGTEIGMWYVAKRTMHSASDSAAFSAATARYKGALQTQWTSEAKSVAGTYNFVDGANGVTVRVNSPATSGNYTRDSNSIEVIISEPQPMVLSGLFLSGPTTVVARSVALTGTPGTGCVLALDGASVDDIFNNGTVDINLEHCDIYDNSPSANALTLVGSATINANGAYIVGNYSTSGNGSLNTTSEQQGGDGTNVNWSSPIPDPYATDLANLAAPSRCDYINQSYQGQANIPASTFTDGQTFCGGLSITGNSKVTFPAGVFYISNGVLSVGGGSELDAPDGTTFVLTGNSSLSFAGGAIINVVADQTGPFPGVAFAVASPAGSGTSSFQGGPTMNILGAVYSPNNAVSWAGGSDTSGEPCTQIVALTIAFKGNTVLGSNCAGYNYPNANIGKVPTKIVE
jgi:Flp pilus assembly protein TadG